MALKAMSMFCVELFADVMKIMFANSFEWIYNGLRQAHFAWRTCLDGLTFGRIWHVSD